MRLLEFRTGSLPLLFGGSRLVLWLRGDNPRACASLLLLVATFGTEIAGTLIAVHGVFVTAIGWKYALWMWGYALAWFVFNDVVKMLVYRLLRAREVV